MYKGIYIYIYYSICYTLHALLCICTMVLQVEGLPAAGACGAPSSRLHVTHLGFTQRPLRTQSYPQAPKWFRDLGFRNLRLRDLAFRVPK